MSYTPSISLPGPNVVLGAGGNGWNGVIIIMAGIYGILTLRQILL